MSTSRHTGDAETLERFRAYLRLLARMQMGIRWQAKLGESDLVQQTLMEAYRTLDQFRGQGEAELAAWLRSILAHQLAHAVRDLGRTRRDVSRERSLEQALERSSACLASWLAADGPSISDQAAHNEQVVRLAQAMERLPEAQREAVVRHYWQGWTTTQLAEHLGRSPAAVAGLLQRGLKALRQEMREVE
jgi:RNA polymerase sigma-70 factor (ECF subfamily)